MNDAEKKIFRAALSKWGGINQRIVAMEEMSELTKEICKELRGCGNVQHMAEEQADVGIMLDQLQIMQTDQDLVRRYRQKKIRRLECRIKGGDQNG